MLVVKQQNFLSEAHSLHVNSQVSKCIMKNLQSWSLSVHTQTISTVSSCSDVNSVPKASMQILHRHWKGSQSSANEWQMKYLSQIAKSSNFEFADGKLSGSLPFTKQNKKPMTSFLGASAISPLCAKATNPKCACTSQSTEVHRVVNVSRTTAFRTMTDRAKHVCLAEVHCFARKQTGMPTCVLVFSSVLTDPFHNQL